MALTKTMLIGLVAVVVTAIASFYAGYYFNYLNGKAGPSITDGSPQNVVQIYGDVESRSGNTLTLKLVNGQTRTATLASETPIVASVIATDQSALTKGTTVLLSGTTDENGEVTADYVTIVPAD